jgi:N-acetylneuraminic acid mutarotase
MKKSLLHGIGALLSVTVWAQSIPDLPIAIGVGSAEVRGDSIYLFGGSASWSGSTRYSTIYKYDGVSWQNYGAMPDNDMFGISSTIADNKAFVYGGYAFGNNKLRIYNFVDNTWENAESSPNISATYGHTIEYLDGSIYLFYNGYVYIYNISTNTWSQGATNDKGGSWLSSVVYQDEIYPVGWTNGLFYKYTPSSDQWTPLASLPYHVSGGALKCVDDKIYYVGGSSGPGAGTFNNTLVYDIASNQWSDAAISISSNRAYMAAVLYKDNFYTIGGLNSDGVAVSNNEFIVAGLPTSVETAYSLSENFELSQNYPNPFEQSTRIRYTIPSGAHEGAGGLPVTLKIYNALGNELATLVNEPKPAGTYEIDFDASALPSGVYFYKIKTGSYTNTKMMNFIR